VIKTQKNSLGGQPQVAVQR